MRSDPTTPSGWATVLATAWGSRFPVDIRQIALEYSKRFDDPILAIEEAAVTNFEGALAPLKKRGGWAVLFNPEIRSPGRINFTLGHELGHYLCHRQQAPTGFMCGEKDMLGGTRSQEREADKFASDLLMPFHDFRAQVDKQRMTLDLLTHCADRYGVSMTAAALKWLECTKLCAAVVVATNGFVFWANRSKAAHRSRIYFQRGMELPDRSLAGSGCRLGAETPDQAFGPGIWGNRPVREIAIFADHYEMTISLLIFEDDDTMPDGWEDEEVPDTFDHFSSMR